MGNREKIEKLKSKSSKLRRFFKILVVHCTVECHIKCFRLGYYGQISENNHHLCHYSISDLVAAYVKQYSNPEYSAA
jgi:hypothetical protein